MADQPDNTEWVLVAHKRVPFAKDEVIGRYPTAVDAVKAFNEVMRHAEFFATYSVEHRNKEF